MTDSSPARIMEPALNRYQATSQGVRESLENLQSAGTLPLGSPGAEDVVLDSARHLVCGLADGRVVRIDPVARSETTLGSTFGRPLGLEVLADGKILVCDAYNGLLRLDPESGDIETLVREVDGRQLRFCSNATAAKDGTIWFTESTARFYFHDYMGAILEGDSTGSLFRRDVNGQVTVAVGALQFPNGVALTEDETAVIFAETTGFRLNKLWIRGSRSGQREILCDNLPGFPDNLSRICNGRFWVAIAAPRDSNSERLHTLPRWIRKAIGHLPARMIPQPQRTAWAMAFDIEGRLLHDLQGTHPTFKYATGVAEDDGKVWLVGVDNAELLAVSVPR